jgi:hypothetical protein
LLKKALLASGFLPRELPPPFNSATFSKALGSVATTKLPTQFNDTKRTYKLGVHTLARVGNLRRTLGLPNPIPFFGLCQAIEANWTALKTAAKASPISLSTPRLSLLGVGGRALQPSCALHEIPTKRIQARANSQYALIADINRFYGSIYTHSIPWALHGKSTAKLNKKPSLFGNLLDVWVRNSQDGQTLGIPIGPDTSLLFAESILGQVDSELSKRIGKLSGWRYIDDYELCFSSLAAAEDTLSTLQELLLGYELILNPAKTRIAESRRDLQAPWLGALKDFDPGKTVNSERKELIRFFDTAFRYSIERPGDYVLSYAVGRLRDIRTDPSNWPLLQSLLLQCTTTEPGTLRLVLSSLFFAQKKGAPIVKPQIEEALNGHVSKHVPLKHTGEVAWALWGLVAFGVSLHEEPAKAVSKLADATVALTALHAFHKKRIPVGLDLSVWSQHMDGPELYGPLWLLAYEANVQGWLPSIGGIDHVLADPCFGYLKKNGVTFYDAAIAPASIEEEGYAAPRNPF